MAVNRRVVTTGSVLLLAVATGYVMQNADALASFLGGNGSVPVVRADPRGAAPARTAVAAERSTTSPVTRATQIGGSLPAEPPTPQLAAPLPREISDSERTDAGSVCALEVVALSSAGAMVDLEIANPCAPRSMVSVRHGPLVFSQVLDDAGRAAVSVPALTENARFDLALPDGAGVSAAVDVPGVAHYERVALQWKGHTGLHLNAFESGAGYGEPGHVHAGASRSPESAASSGAGFLTVLGDGSRPGSGAAEVYTFPAGAWRGTGDVRLTVEAEVTAATCGREIRAVALRPLSGEGLETLDLMIDVPDCEAIGEFLVLGNILRDMRLAAN